MQRPELLAPAGNLDKLYSAAHFGADAIYVGLKKFSMRSFAGNFSLEELLVGTDYLHKLGKKIYVTVNVLPFDDEYPELKKTLGELGDIGVDAVIISDPGLLSLMPKNVETHLSTQCSVTNAAAANFWFSQGISQIVLARELSLERLKTVASGAKGRLEIFIHGAVCIAWSGRCLLSLYSVGRDPRRGECAQPCRWKYALMEEKRPGQYFEISEDGGTFIMNSRDLNMIEHLQELADAGVTSFKIEGRTKSAYYTAAVTNAYRHAIDAIAERAPVPEIWIRETDMVSHRPYSTGFYFGEPGQVTEGPNYFSGADVMAVVERCDEEGNAVLTQRNKFSRGDTLELLTPEGEPCSFVVERLFNTYGEEIEDAKHAMMELHMRLPKAAPRLSIVRKRR
jgi:putative protease